MVTDEHFDAVVVGAGAAGLCCAGELVLQGKRPLVICETAEVGHTFRSVWIGANRGTVQALAWQSTWGGWWLPLARALDVPIKIRDYNPIEMTVAGSGTTTSIPYVGSATAFADVFSAARSEPLTAEARKQIVACVGAGLRLSPEEVFTLDRVRFVEWLQEHGAGSEVAAMITGFCGRPNALTAEDALEHLSTACGLWTLRVMYFHEGVLCEVVPDPRDGVWIPIAKEIERRGGEIRRGQRVENVVVEDGRAVGVSLRDGTEARAGAVAMATSNARTAKIVDPVPAELQAALDYSGPTPQRQLIMFVLLNQPLMPPVALSISRPDGSRLGAVVPTHHTNVEPGKQLFHLIVTNIGDRSEQDVLDEVAGHLTAVFPGYRDAVIDVKTLVHTSEHWLDYVTIGPKLPRKSPSIDGLWYVGQGVEPVAGFWTEAAASSGVLGARAIAAAS